GVRGAECSEDLPFVNQGEYQFHPGLIYVLLLVFLSKKRVGSFKRLKCAGSINPKAAICVISNVSGSGLVKCLQHFFGVCRRNKRYEFAEGLALWHKNTCVYQPQPVTNPAVNTRSNVVEIGMYRVNGYSASDGFDDGALDIIGPGELWQTLKNDWMV